MKKIFWILIVIEIVFAYHQFVSAAETSDSAIISQEVIGCDNDGTCESDKGEDYYNCPADCPAGSVLPRDTIPPAIFNLSITEITPNSAKINWETNKQALCQFFWGEGREYEKGSVSETYFSRKHTNQLTELFPSTLYHFKIVCKDTSQNESETADQQFTTLSLPDFVPPINVSDFEAIPGPGDGKITLKWKNPPDIDFKSVWIVRSEKFYPSEPWEGEMVYNDKGTSFIDSNLTPGKRYYYTAFAYDRAGNYASGMVASAVPLGKVPPWVVPEIPPELRPPVVPAPPEIEKLKIEDFDFIQDGERLRVINGKLEIKSKAPLTISIAYEKVPEVLKTIMVTLEKEGKYFSFLLRINREKTAYQAVILPPEPGVYPLTLSILDFKNQTLKKIKGEMIIKAGAAISQIFPWQENPNFWKYLVYALLAILALLASRRLREKPAPYRIYSPVSPSEAGRAGAGSKENNRQTT